MSTNVVKMSTHVLISERAVAPIPGVPMIPMVHVNKPEKFGGTNFKRWQQKMIFYLTTLNLARC